jgi:hypothetical protein
MDDGSEQGLTKPSVLSAGVSVMLHEARSDRGVVLALLLVGVGQAAAFDSDDIIITRQGRAYQSQTTFEIASPMESVTSVLTDYEHPGRLIPDVTKREVSRGTDGIVRVRTEVRGCVLFFCKDLTLTQDVSVVGGTIQADTVPEESDFRAGYVSWVVTSNDNGGSHVRYQSVMEPDFPVPYVIGRLFVRNRLRQQVLATVENLEREAAQEPVPGAD